MLGRLAAFVNVDLEAACRLVHFLEFLLLLLLTIFNAQIELKKRT